MKKSTLVRSGSRWLPSGETWVEIAAVLCGVLVREMLEAGANGEWRLDAIRLIAAVLGSMSILPLLQQVLKEQADKMSLWMQVVLAFQYGFWWRTLVGLDEPGPFA